MYDLPTSVDVCGVSYDIETDYRAILDIFSVLGDVDLNNEEKAVGTLGIFYKDFCSMPSEHMGEALKKCFWFINCGNDETPKKPLKLTLTSCSSKNAMFHTFPFAVAKSPAANPSSS